MCRKRFDMDAYLTVEAVLVLPIVIGSVLFVLYLMFFQYDRCLMEHNTGVLALRACTLQMDDREDLMRVLMEQSEGEDVGYLAWSMGEAVIEFKGNRMRVTRIGELKYPFYGWLSSHLDAQWESGVCYENHRTEPVNFIRNCRKIVGGK